ncbi:MAG: hypothetical protein F6K39_15375 [Okeania sp. SIO3B3]|nr:hypothetical protein [Okeania sp. SIO3B3]
MANSDRYRYEGVEFEVPLSSVSGAEPVYRFENQITGTYFYTLQDPEGITENFPELQRDGIAFYAFPPNESSPSGTVPVHRFFNEATSIEAGTPVHFYTGTEENKDNVIENFSGFAYEGAGWYAYEIQGSSTSTPTAPPSISSDNTLNLDTNSLSFKEEAEPIVVNIADTEADIPTSLDDSSTIDLMVVYTPEARQAEGGTDAMEELIKLAVDGVNEAFDNSEIETQLRLVHTAEVNYTESGSSRTDLTRLKEPSDTYMDEVHELRDDYGADIVSLFASDFDDNTGGRGYLMNIPGYGFEDSAFNVLTTSNARSRRTLAHEIGHNLGLTHERDNSSRQGTFSYSYGYITPSGAGTIMSTAINRLPYFSNPAINYEGEALGRENFANSALAINQVIQYAANWRQSVVNTPTPPPVNPPNGGNTFEVSFDDAINFDVENAPRALAVGDFNSDDTLDLAVTNSNSDSVSVLLGEGDGSFSNAGEFDAGDNPSSIAVGEFNGDGISDLVVTNSFSGSENISVLLGEGNGSFSNAGEFTVGDDPNSIAVGDFNDDGISDVAVSNSSDKVTDGLGDNVSVLLANGDGGFSDAINYDAIAGDNTSIGVQQFAVGEFNGDGILDLAVIEEIESQGSILLGNGDGSFGNAISFDISVDDFADFPSSLAVGEFNGDGISDLVTTTGNGQADINPISVLLGEGNGRFGESTEFDTEQLPRGVTVGDFNNDSISDLVVANFRDNDRGP